MNDQYRPFFEETEDAFSVPELIPIGFTAKTYKEKKEIKKTAVSIGASLLIILGITALWGALYYLVMSVLGVSSQKAEAFISEPAVLTIFQIILSTTMFSLPFLIIFKKRIGELISFKKPEKENRVTLLLFGVAFCSFANIMISISGAFFEALGFNYNVDMGENPKGIFGFFLSVIATAVVPALMEEFGCRGVIMGSLRKFGDGFAVLVSALLFGLLHGNFIQIPFAFLVGLVLGYITIKSGSIWIAVAVHFFNNFVSVVIDYAMSRFSIEAQNIAYSIFLAVTMLLGLIALLVRERENNLFVFEKSSTESSFAQKIKWFFSSPVIIVFMALCLIESILFFI